MGNDWIVITVYDQDTLVVAHSTQSVECLRHGPPDHETGVMILANVFKGGPGTEQDKAIQAIELRRHSGAQ